MLKKSSRVASCFTFECVQGYILCHSALKHCLGPIGIIPYIFFLNVIYLFFFLCKNFAMQLFHVRMYNTINYFLQGFQTF